MTDISVPTLDFTVQRLYDAVNNPNRWDEAIDSMVKATGAISGIIAVRDELVARELNSQPYELNVMSAAFRSRPEEIATYFERYEEYEKAEIEFLLTCGKHEILDDSNVYPDIELPIERADFRYRAEKFNIHRRLATRLDDNRRWAELLLLQFGQDQVADSNMESVKRVIPHVAKAVELGRIFNELNRRFNAALSVLDKVTIGMCLAREDGTILLSNESARAIFDSNPMINLSGEGQLVFDKPVIEATIRNAIANIARTANGSGRVQEVLCVHSDEKSERTLLIEVAPIRDSLSEMAKEQGYALVSLIDPAVDHSVDTERLGLIYRLTPSEMAVCKYLVSGNTYSQIAAERCVSIETIKTQVRAISDKTSMPSRIGLVRLALKLSPPMMN